MDVSPLDCSEASSEVSQPINSDLRDDVTDKMAGVSESDSSESGV